MGQMNWLLRSVCVFFFLVEIGSSSLNWQEEIPHTYCASSRLRLLFTNPDAIMEEFSDFFLALRALPCSACFHVPNARQVFRFVLRQSLFTLTDPSAASWQLGVEKLGADSVSWWKWIDYRLWLESGKRWKLNFNYIYTTVEKFKNIFHSFHSS